MESWSTEKLPNQFVRYVYAGCTELNTRLQQEPELGLQIEEVIRESLSRTPMEALDLESGLSILIGDEPARAVAGCLRYLETSEEVDDLRNLGFHEEFIRRIRYLVARYGPVLKAIRRRHNHPAGWHKCGHTVNKAENGTTYLHLKILRNDDRELILEDDTESLLRLMNLMLEAIQHGDDYQVISEKTLLEFTARCEKLAAKASERGVHDLDGTKH